MKSFFIVANLSTRTITLTDIRAEIRPNMTLNLENVARREDIERSLDLEKAFSMKLLKFVKKSKIVQPKITVENALSEDQLRKLIQQAMKKAAEERAKIKEDKSPIDVSKIRDMIKKEIASSVGNSIEGKLDGKFDSILKAIQSIPATQTVTPEAIEKAIGPEVDLAQLAKITQQGVDSISKEISGEEKTKKVEKIKISTNISKLAEELD